MTSLPPVPSLSPHLADRLAAALRAAPYTPAALRGIWGVDADAALEANDPAPARRACARVLGTRCGNARGAGAAEGAEDGAALAALASVFLLDQPVEPRHLAAALGGDLLDELCAAGLFEECPVPESPLRSVLALTCHPVPVGVPRRQRPGDETLLLASDHGTLTTPGTLDGDYVLGYGGAGRTLAEITPRERVGLAADLGTGCGIQAVLLARHAARVIATDISRRALACTALSAMLNGVADAVELRLGSLYEPLTETVDLLVSNPPFVITPRRADPQGSGRFEYRDGGRTGDAIMREVIEGAPARLAPEGQAVFLGNWEYGEGRLLPHEWLEPRAEAQGRTEAEGRAEAPEPAGGEPEPAAAATSAMVIERQRMSPAEYARTWIRDGGVQRASPRWQSDSEAWLDDLEARGVESVGFGWVRLHRLAAEADAVSPVRSFARIETGPGSNPAGLASFLDLRLGLLEWLGSATDAELEATAFVLAGDVTEHRHLRPGAEDPTMLTIEQGAGLARTFQADPALAGFLGVCDGSLTLGQIAAALAQLLDADPAALTRQLVDQVRSLVPEGVLAPAEA